MDFETEGRTPVPDDAPPPDSPPALHGRETEFRQLWRAFERVADPASARAEAVLVEGWAGIGKTALIRRLQRPVIQAGATFARGKFDQLARGVPYGALVEALRDLVSHWLTESEARLAERRVRIEQALGTSGGALAELIPQIAALVGPQPAPAAVGPAEARNRFRRVLQRFLTAAAQPAHPLVLFLDDLQWADDATVDLIEPLLAGGELRHLLLVGAVRDAEGELPAALQRLADALVAAGVGLQRLKLDPLEPLAFLRLVADHLRVAPAQVESLADWVRRKTGGNPFFALQYLDALERSGRLRFDRLARRWLWRVDELAAAPLADNVVELTMRRLRDLPEASRQLVALAACLGHRFDVGTLATLAGLDREATAVALRVAVEAGLVVVDAGVETPGHAFVHDRVQQAAYALIPHERRAAVHLRIGRLLRDRAGTDAGGDDALFDRVHHLNLGRAAIDTAAERAEVARLGLAAAERAKASTAFRNALELLDTAAELIADADPALRLRTATEAAECAYLCGDFDGASARTETLLHAALPAEGRARVLRLRSRHDEHCGRYAEAVAGLREALHLCGVELPVTEAEAAAALEDQIVRIEAQRAGRPIATLLDSAACTDARRREAMAMLIELWSSAFLVGVPTLARLISATMVRLSLQHGACAESAYGCVTHAITVGPLRGDYAAAYAWGELALAVNRRFADARLRAKVLQQFQAHVALWCRPHAACLELAHEACRAGLENGDFLYAVYAAGTSAWAAMFATDDLARFEAEQVPTIGLLERLRYPAFAAAVRVLVQWSRALRGRTADPLSLSDASFDEDAYRERTAGHPLFATIHAVARLDLCVRLGTPQQAIAAAEVAARSAQQVPGTIWPVQFDFLAALAQAFALDRGAAGAERVPADLRRVQAALARLAGHCAQNFLGPALLLDAEIARIDGRDADAFEAYAQAIEHAAVHGLRREQALAHERCGRLLAATGRPAQARLHLAQARAGYASWGATAKVDALQREHAALLAPRATAGRGGSADGGAAAATGAAAPDATSADLDGLALAAQALATRGGFDALVRRLLQVAIERAGAECGAVVVETEGGAEAYRLGADGAAVDGPLPLDRCDLVPAGLIHYVRRTGQPVRVDEAEADERHGADPYVVAHRPRSLLAVAALEAGRPVGVLYLEHRRRAAAFAATQVRALQVLATLIAIALQNARLVDGLKREVAERRESQAALAAALAEVERLGAELEAENSYLRRDLIANVSHDLRTPLVAIRGYLEVLAARHALADAALRREWIDTALRQSEHLGTLVDELFELARLDFKGIELQREPFAFDELAMDAVQKFRLLADGRRIELRVDVPPRLPRADGDLSLVERVLDNLIGNALKHTPPGGRVELCVADDGGRIVARVSDTGPGIEAEDLPFVFDRHYRGSGVRRSDGAGLGLQIARRIVELHGGALVVERSDEQGTCMRFALPAHAPG
jgi:predicted ATPase/signal transduction histidine kinase